MSVSILDAGDAALTIEFGDAIDPGLLAAVNALDAAIARRQAEEDRAGKGIGPAAGHREHAFGRGAVGDRKSTRLNSSHRT